MRKILLIICIAVGLASCANPRRIMLSGPLAVESLSLSKVEVSCIVENCSAYRVNLLDAKFKIHYASAALADVMLAGPVSVAKCSREAVMFPLRVKFSNPLAALSALDWENLDWDNLYVTGEGVIRSGLGRKKIRFTDYPASEILTIFTE